MPVVRVHPTLPIFRLDEGDQAIFYTPGEVLVTSRTEAVDVEAALGVGSVGPISHAHGVARTLEARGRDATRAWHQLAEKTFEPECLTLYLSNRCNLGCSYCYAAPIDEARARTRLRMLPGPHLDTELPLLSEDVVHAAARLVARCCASKSKPLTVVFHGGGEPTLHWSLLERIRARVAEVAGESGIPLWTYIATHGVLPESRARWLADHFNSIGLSCDGPPDIQNANRPTAAGAPTAAAVERTARVFADAGADYAVRVTVTRASVRRQSEILVYICDRLGARTVRIEPAYDARRATGSHLRPEDAAAFVGHFLEAREVARQRGCDLQVSGVRPDEIHGPYCNPLREVLQLTPDGAATACFLCTDSRQPDDAAMAFGRLDPLTGEFAVDRAHVAALRRRAARVPARCEACVNVYHCARDCPDVCVITAQEIDEAHEGFRCRVQKLLGRQWIKEMAGLPRESLGPTNN